VAALRLISLRHWAAILALCAIACPGAAIANDGLAQRVLEIGEARWRAVGTLSSSVTGARLAIFEEHTSGRSKIVRQDSLLTKGVTVLSISASDVLLDVAGTPIRLAVSAGAGSKLGVPVSELPDEAKLSPPRFVHVKMTLEEFHDSARGLRAALRSGDIALGENDRGIAGVLIQKSPPGSLAARLGLQPGDVVVAVNGSPAADEGAAHALLDAAGPDQNIPYAFRRGDVIGQGILEVVADN
jgi:hypothetical protein